ncbi:Glucocorticoid modulatory element-binding protein 2 [Bagarius yarrelli]|uniref:Glucocorticoid modulatory element-binding protein 2 n=1 Tax=Bagarius yarrelli TaxID=175774 RepID=A0A556U055_BAGYA|nr:Glucocorticoid modulatory element-binding protein 2 [Bagarius yarrelli]
MASTSEENVHVEEVVVVTTPDSSAQSPSTVDMKNMLENADLRQPELENMEQSLESESSPAISLPKEAVLVKFSGDADIETDILYQITCGDSKADLVWKKFVCPGINVKCVQFNNHLISPKEFVYLAGKSTLKDWKRAIRLNGTMLRKIMDSGELDFYQHSKLCSNTCRSTKIDLVGTRASLSSQLSTETTATPSAADDDTMMFWKGLKDAGLLDDIVEDLRKEIESILKGLEERVHDPPLQVKDAALLNNIVQNFGMLDLVKKVLASHKTEMDRCREQYTQSLAALERQCDEHRKRAKELKSKSQHLNNVLMNLTPVITPPAPKRPRLTRAVSGPASVMAPPVQPTQFTLPITQLTGISLDKILSAVGGSASSTAPFIGSYTVLTSPGGAELQPDTSNLTVLSSDVAGGSAIVKMLSPFQVLTLPTLGSGTTLQNLTAPAGGALGSVIDPLQEKSRCKERSLISEPEIYASQQLLRKTSWKMNSEERSVGRLIRSTAHQLAGIVIRRWILMTGFTFR